jgi:hypothetical protein
MLDEYLSFMLQRIGVFHTMAMPSWEQSARRLIDILITGSRSTHMHRSARPRTRQE